MRTATETRNGPGASAKKRTEAANPTATNEKGSHMSTSQHTESHRCPPIAFGEPPSNGWRLVDCRTWTNMARAAPGAPLAALEWPEPGLR